MNRRGPFVSIGVPVYNGEAFLQEALNSILSQTYTDFELIISDNASTDRTEQICRTCASRDTRIRYMRNETNVGAAENYNIVFKASNGRYFKWASHDDVCAPEFLERCLAVLENEDSTVLCYPTTVIIDEKGKHLRTYQEEIEYLEPAPAERLRSWLFRRPGGECNAVFGVIRSSVLAQTHLIGKYMASDLILLGELVLRGRVRKISDPLFLRRDHPSTSGRAQHGAEEILVWFDTSKRGKIHMPKWRWSHEYIRAIGRVPMGLVEKGRCLALVTRWFIMIRQQLKTEVLEAAKKIFRRRAWLA
ncbi:MAG: glycosyltransferase [Candidatus Krumholzibacteria bacterium]|nr:glycosyltransferase [Candidatus Krumholzibacteria bacterium]